MSKEKQIENCKQELLNALGLRINEEFNEIERELLKDVENSY